MYHLHFQPLFNTMTDHKTQSKLVTPESATNLDLGRRESSRDSTIENGFVLLILSRLRSLNLVALARSKFQVCVRFWYSGRGLKKRVQVPLLPWKKREVISQEKGRAAFGLKPDQKTILIFGGSQGAFFLNEMAPRTIASLKEKVQVIHLTGNVDEIKVREHYAKLNITACVKAFEKEMDFAYAAATVAFCRSGAGTIAELIRFEVPALLIPYPYAADQHQVQNALFLEKTVNGAVHLPESSLTADKLLETVKATFAREMQMKQAIQAFKTQNKKGTLSTLVAEVLKRL